MLFNNEGKEANSKDNQTKSPGQNADHFKRESRVEQSESGMQI